MRGEVKNDLESGKEGGQKREGREGEQEKWDRKRDGKERTSMRWKENGYVLGGEGHGGTGRERGREKE